MIEHEKVLLYRWVEDGISVNGIQRVEQITRFFIDTYVSERVMSGPYVVCFSRKGNDLGQWRGYAQVGYSIGFDKEKLFGYAEGPKFNAKAIRPVIYGDQAWEIAGQHALRIVESIKSIDGDKMLTHADISELAYPVEEHIPYLKHGAFALEDEERLVVNNVENVKFRSSALGIVPYSTVNIDLSAIREIVVGPGPNQDIRVNAVKILVKELLPQTNVKIITSAIPFRG